MLLADLLAGYHDDKGRPFSGEATGVAYDSRLVQPGNVFVALKGTRVDAHDRLGDAVQQGASAVVVDAAWRAAHPEDLGVPTVPVEAPRWVLSELAARFYGHPSEAFSVVGVTGTNGKTTTTHLIEAILQTAGKTTGLIGTLGSRFAGGVVETGHTTPLALELQGIFARMRRSAVDAVVMEVSSHALDQARVAHAAFDVGVFTNLTVDHLDYHGTLEAYGDAKAKLFEALNATGRAVINRDDPAYARFVAASAAPVLTYSAQGQEADLMAEDLSLHAGGSRWTLVTPWGRAAVSLRLPGLFNVSNALAAAGAALALGLDLETVAKGLSQVGGVPGRVEVVTAPDHPFSVLVDYAHTPDGLENVLRTARGFTRGRLLVVFGCGGDRDASKRPMMGKVAAEGADLVFLTSDNPRSEDPQAIMRQVAEGITSPYEAFVDRREAIHAAIRAARPGDVVVIAGKGHETYQIIGDQTLAFDDREVAREAIAERTVAR
ncbi:UDP-N-acetylmuramoyl-L-alanyl-D-glutamate--2,6-diaminopimelate ligase [bacterium]|nr:UDP-N-acetylmuramoyl-L-alanyl-D-glutamate--2,6-diaminopimelate ligase [bacterium]